MKNITFLLIALVSMLPLRAAAAEQWRMHPSWSGQVRDIIDTPDYLYILGYSQYYWPETLDNSQIFGALFRYDKQGEETTYLNVLNKLSSPVPVSAAYNYDKKYLLVTYSDGNIDLIYDNGDVKNITGFMIADETYAKSVNGISFDPENNLAYLSTKFGYITVDDSKGEIGTTRTLDREVNATASFDGKVFVGDNNGLTYTDLADATRTEHRVEGVGAVTEIIPLGDRLYIRYGSGWNGFVVYIAKGDAENKTVFVDNSFFDSMTPAKDAVNISGYFNVQRIDSKGEKSIVSKTEADRGKIMVSYDGRTFWMNDGLKGITGKRPAADGSSWSMAGASVCPNASNAFLCTSMAYSPTYGMLVRNHGIGHNFSQSVPGTPDFISGLKNLEWTPYSIASRLPEATALTLNNPNGLMIDPRNPDQVYCGSMLDGFLRLDLSDPKKSMRFGKINDPASGNPSFVGVVPEQSAWNLLCPFGEGGFDVYGNLWIPYNNSNLAAEGKALELWWWTPEERAATTTAANYRPLHKWTVNDAEASSVHLVRPLTASSNKNILLYSTTTYLCDLLLLDHKGTLDSRSDDQTYSFSSTIYDQDGTEMSPEYFRCFLEDKSTGNVWVGTSRGVFHFNPNTLLKSQGDTRIVRPKVARNDGTQLADYLLDGAIVNDITSDPKGRKWFATGGGGIVVTSSNGTNIVKTYTSDNSLLPGDIVYKLCYNPSSNSMMISTDGGLAELYLSSDATEEGDSGVTVYPNPVRPDYYGYVTVEGLEDGSIVKITDASGGLVKELGFSEGSSIKWDVTNMNHKRVRSGVYYVLASGGPESTGFAAVGKILVVN